jgi:hypothetical protein
MPSSATTGIRHIRSHFGGSAAASALLAELERRERLLTWLRSKLPEPLARHCRQAALERETLVIVVDSPVWVARLRFAAQEFLAEFPAGVPDGQGPESATTGAPRPVTRCQVKALPPDPRVSSRTKIATRTGARANGDAAKSVAAVAASVRSRDLADSLHRLAKTLEGRTRA